ncbi:MAG: hypothetical protein Q7R22_005150 [Verrucomicrobiota bacterium JB025]
MKLNHGSYGFLRITLKVAEDLESDPLWKIHSAHQKCRMRFKSKRTANERESFLKKWRDPGGLEMRSEAERTCGEVRS